MKKKWIAFGLVSALACTAFAGCGKDGGQQPESAETLQEETDPGKRRLPPATATSRL